MSSEEGRPSILEDLQEFFGEINDALESNLSKYGYTSIYGHFVGISLLTSFSLAVAFSYKDSANGVAFGAELVVFTILAALVVFPLFSYVLVHVYHAFFKTVAGAKRALSWQMLAVFLSILLTFVLASTIAIEGGFVITGILLFVQPLTEALYNKPGSTDDVFSTLNKVYLVVLAIANLIQLILKFAGWF